MKCFLLLTSLFLSGFLYAQTTGRIVFEEKMDLHRTLPPEREDMKDMIPQFNTSVYEFVFTQQESIYQPKIEEEVTEVTSAHPGARMSMRFGRDNRVVYKHLENENMIDSRDFMQKQFLITGMPTARKWKMGTKQKEIAGYVCMDAHTQIDSANSLVAWFTPALQVYNGPSDYQGLPGMILQIDINEGHRTITATEIVLDDVDTSLISAPKKGKEVTAEEFENIREEKLKEMGLYGRGGPAMQQMMIIRN